MDYERIEQSDTWALASDDMRPWLLMVWMTAWRQVPCGSLPANDDLIAARIGMPIRQFQANKDILLRGWSLCSDGRLYHQVITEQVIGMIENCRREAKRKAEWRAKKKQALAQDVPWDTTGTDASATPPEPEPEPEPSKALNTHTPTTSRGRVCGVMKAMGLAGVNPGHPGLQALIDAGATDEEFAGAAKAAIERHKNFAYALGILNRQRIEAAEIAAKAHKGQMPTQQRPLTAAEQRVLQAAPGIASPDLLRRASAPTPFTIDMESTHGPANALGGPPF